MIDFERCEFDSWLLGEHDDCAIKAVAIATQTDYTTVWELFRDEGRETAKPAKVSVLKAVLGRLGYMTYQHGQPADIGIQNADFSLGSNWGNAQNDTAKQGSYLIASHMHIAAIVDGIVQDHPKRIDGTVYTQVIGIWEVVKISDIKAEEKAA